MYMPFSPCGIFICGSWYVHLGKIFNQSENIELRKHCKSSTKPGSQRFWGPAGAVSLQNSSTNLVETIYQSEVLGAHSEVSYVELV